VGTAEKAILLPITAFVVALGFVTAFKLINGRISLRGLLRDPLDGRISPASVQAFISTIAFAGAYVASVGGRTDPSSLPPVDPKLLYLVGGSNGLMLGSRALRQLLSRLRRRR
jgi:hypothetical protein